MSDPRTGSWPLQPQKLHSVANRLVKNRPVRRGATVSPETWLSFVCVTTRVFRPAKRILYSGVTEINNSQKFFFM